MLGPENAHASGFNIGGFHSSFCGQVLPFLHAVELAVVDPNPLGSREDLY